MYLYPCRLMPETEEPGFTATFRDIPEAITCGDTLEEALEAAQDVLHCYFSHLVDEREDVPSASQPEAGERLVAPPVLTQAKLALYEAMRAQKVTKAELARRLGVDEAAVRRLCDLEHRSHMDKIEAALAALGLRPNFEVAVADRAA